MNFYIDLMNQFLEDKISFPEFEKEWLNAFLNDQLPDNKIFDGDKWEIMDDIHTKISYTGEDDPGDDRKYGLMDVNEFREWLKEKIKEL